MQTKCAKYYDRKFAIFRGIHARFTRTPFNLYACFTCARFKTTCVLSQVRQSTWMCFIVTAVASVVFPCCFRKNHVLLVRSDRYKFWKEKKITCMVLDRANRYWNATLWVANTSSPNNQVTPRRGKSTTNDLRVDLKIEMKCFCHAAKSVAL